MEVDIKIHVSDRKIQVNNVVVETYICQRLQTLVYEQIYILRQHA